MKKKIVTLFLSLTLALSLAACGGPKVSGPVEREPVTSANDNAPAGTPAESPSGEAAENSSALADWYDSKDRTELEDMLNETFADAGMVFSLGIEEPGTIIYTYQFTEPLGMDGDALQDYFQSSLDAQYQTFLSEIKNFKTAYGIPLTAIRINYLDADGTTLYTMDYTEDYVPSSDISQGSYDSLEDWMNSTEQEMVVSTINAQLLSSGISVAFYAEDNVMVMDYSFTEQQDMEGMGQDEITAFFDTQVAESFSGLVSNLFDTFELSYGLVLDDIKLVFHNADGTELYSKYFSEL